MRTLRCIVRQTSYPNTIMRFIEKDKWGTNKEIYSDWDLAFTYKDRNKENEEQKQSARLEVRNYLIVLLKVANSYNFEITPSILHAIFFLLQNEDGIKLNLTFRPQFLGVESQELNETLKELEEKEVIKPVYKEFKDPITGDIITYISNYKVQEENVEIKVDPKIIEVIEKWVKTGKKGLLNYIYTKYEGIVGYKALKEEPYRTFVQKEG